MTPPATNETWLDPGDPLPPLPAHTAQLYLLETSDDDDLHALPWLTAEERTRADRFRHAQARLHFIAGRAALRRLLSAHMLTHPQSLTLTADNHGKLHLPSTDLRFNLAHSGGCILLALTRNAEVGIDLEAIQPNRDLRLIASKHFTAQENAALSIDEPNAFFHLWTRKEAILKADGRGLALGLSSFNVPLTPRESCPVTLPANPATSRTFFVTGLNLPVPLPFAAAVALSEPAFRLERYRFPSGCLTREHPHRAAPNDVS